jgi:hypothetical protein
MSLLLLRWGGGYSPFPATPSTKEGKKTLTKKKTTNPTTGKKKALKPRKSWRDEYLNFVSWTLYPVDKDYIRSKAEAFVEWARLARSEDHKAKKRLTYERWLEEVGIPYKTMEGWSLRDPYVLNCLELGMMILGNNLEEGLLTKEYSEKATMFQLHNYLPRWKKMERYQDERIIRTRDKEEKKPTQVILNMTDYSKIETGEKE